MEKIQFIIPPPRASKLEIFLISIILTSFLFVILASNTINIVTIVFLGLMVIIAYFLKATQALHLSIFWLAWVFAAHYLPVLGIWLVNFCLILAAYSAVVFSVPTLHRSFFGLRPGQLNKQIRALILGTIIISSLALIAWYLIFQPDLSDPLALIQEIPVFALPLAGLFFALFNAAIEEFMFRGIIMHALDSAFGPGIASIFIQAILFGALHYHGGFPNGIVGAGLAFIYGILLGVIRRLSRGILAPWLAHVLADLVIFIILATTLISS